ncbi:hypothetical protein [Cupriavidus sp. 2SB]|uniref:hypothetical protein n=1 Tax=Cupriavidus sp. 2SB TaxID=2502199 RepID=UPI0010F76567|nr:hypothetical protein [Cupriavidus sp. 2SB]
MTTERPFFLTEAGGPKPPSVVWWVASLPVFIAVNAVIVLLMWTAEQRVEMPWLWPGTLGASVLVWLGHYALLWQDHRKAKSEFAEELADLRAKREEPVESSASMLAIMDAACWTALGTEAIAGQIEGAGAALRVRKIGVAPVRHTRLDLAGEGGRLARIQAMLPIVVERIADAVRRLPESRQLEVRLIVPSPTHHEVFRLAWNACWHAAGLRPVEAEIEPLPHGSMTLDGWFDADGDAMSEKYVLLVAIQLHEVEMANSAEAVVTLLFGEMLTAMRDNVAPLALLPPIGNPAVGNLSGAVGVASAYKSQYLWAYGLSADDEPALRAARRLDRIVTKFRSDPVNILDVDVALGNAGVAGFWLTIAMAVARTVSTGESQAVVSREEEGYRLGSVFGCGSGSQQEPK